MATYAISTLIAILTFRCLWVAILKSLFRSLGGNGDELVGVYFDNTQAIYAQMQLGFVVAALILFNACLCNVCLGIQRRFVYMLTVAMLVPFSSYFLNRALALEIFVDDFFGNVLYGLPAWAALGVAIRNHRRETTESNVHIAMLIGGGVLWWCVALGSSFLYPDLEPVLRWSPIVTALTGGTFACIFAIVFRLSRFNSKTTIRYFIVGNMAGYAAYLPNALTLGNYMYVVGPIAGLAFVSVAKLLKHYAKNEHIFIAAFTGGTVVGTLFTAILVRDFSVLLEQIAGLLVFAAAGISAVLVVDLFLNVLSLTMRRTSATLPHNERNHNQQQSPME